jgi:hypothetical protein
MGACEIAPTSTTCGAPMCAGGMLTGAGKCNGTGMCALPAPMSCAPYACNSAGVACWTTCTLSQGCAMGHWCANNMCVAQLGPGMPCMANYQCLSGTCSGSGFCA